MLTVHEAAKQLDVSEDTIRRWAKKGLIKSSRSPNNHRIFDIDELERVKNKYLDSANHHEFKVLCSEKTKYTAIELFSGAGGLALGLENAGFNSKMLLEIDKDASATLRKNRPNWEIINDDIRNINFSGYKEKVDIVAGGFPCQSFSYAGHGRGFEDARGTLFFEFARCVNETRPKIALGENVRGLLKHDNGRTLSTMLRILDELDYDVTYQLLRAQFLDVPQKRERVFIVGVRRDLKIKNAYFPVERDYTVSIRQALKDCPESPGAKYPERKRQILELIPPGGYWRDLPLEIQKEYMQKSFYLGGGKTGMARRLSWDEPSLTLTCAPAQKQTERCHPGETRPLSIREYARIQTFPDNWEFRGSLAAQYKQVGNAVPVNLGYHMGKCLISMLEKKIGDNMFEKKFMSRKDINSLI